MIMFGTFTFWMIGVIDWLWPRIVRREWYSNGLRSWHFWLSTAGIVIMFTDLTISGLIAGFMQRELNPWTEIVQASVPFWWVRTVSGGMLLTGLFCGLYNMLMTARKGAPYVEANHLVAVEAE
jgi:cytochrome c oxidase cbb3-type subunit 1